MKNFFQERTNNSPKIYCYTELSPEYEELVKVGYTVRDINVRMREHYPTLGPKGIERYKLLLVESAMRNDGTSFIDKTVHKVLEKAGFKNVGGEWYRCNIKDVKAGIKALRIGSNFEKNRDLDFPMRPEQESAVEITSNYFKNYKRIEKTPPHFLWNCKMRFGKTFAAYKLAEKMGWRKILVLTFQPAVESSWKDDLLSHEDFRGWKYFSKSTEMGDLPNEKSPFVCFGSFQDYLGKNDIGGIKYKNQSVHDTNWDCIILDEYHYGAWRDRAKELFDSDDKSENKKEIGEEIEDWDENISPLKTNNYLYLSGTPFRAIESGEFIEEQIFNWTYSDEQESKFKWQGDDNPYDSLPRMVMLTYEMPESINHILKKGEYDEFDLNEFFKATGNEEDAKFKYENEVQGWLDLLRGKDFNNIYSNLKLNKNKPVLPYSDSRLLSILNHTFWFLPSVSSCYAMRNLLLKNNNLFFHDYEIIVCAGNKAGMGSKALIPVQNKMSDNPLSTKTITLSCRKLYTGVTVRPWTAVFMLKNTSSPETYFQTAFRCQSPWTMKSDNQSLKEEIIKDECYVFDFAPNRALRLVTEYCCRLNLGDNNTKLKISEFIKFLPILCFDGSSMKSLNSEEVLDFGMVGTSGSQLAKKFESAQLVNVDNLTLKKLLNNPEALEKIMKIEGFRNLNSDLESIINKTKLLNNTKTTDKDKDTDKKKLKKEITKEEKEIRNKRREIQEKLLKFGAKIPVFMYLTDYREETLKDVITQLEPKLFKKVTSLSVQDFELLLSLGLFNSSLMNSAIFAFKRYENASLHYKGYTKHKPQEIGLFDTKISNEEFKSI